MILLLDIGNTHTHLGLSRGKSVMRQANIPTKSWFTGAAAKLIAQFVGKHNVVGAALCSVVPKATNPAARLLKSRWQVKCLVLTPKTLKGVGIDYPKPNSIGPDRLANAVAARKHFGAPSVVVDFGTAVTFDVIDASGNYIGGIIAPGLSVMTDYLHEKTALLPKVTIRDLAAVVGKNTEQAMLIGAVHGYRGLIRELIRELKAELGVRKLPIVATGGYAALISRKIPEIIAVDPNLTLEGLRLVWQSHQLQSG